MFFAALRPSKTKAATAYAIPVRGSYHHPLIQHAELPYINADIEQKAGCVSLTRYSSIFTYKVLQNKMTILVKLLLCPQIITQLWNCKNKSHRK